MRLQIQLHGVLQQVCGRSEYPVELADSQATVADALQELCRHFPALGSHLPRTAYAIDTDIVRPERQLSPGEKLVLIPPVSGG